MKSVTFLEALLQNTKKTISNGDVISPPLTSSMQHLTSADFHECNNMPFIPRVMKAAYPHAARRVNEKQNNTGSKTARQTHTSIFELG